jgi:hypothetical protein
MTDSSRQPGFSQEYTRATRLVTSRRVKQEQSTAIRQSMFLVGGALGIILLALIFIPMLIRFLGGLGGPVANIEDDLPPQVPHLSAPVEATYSAQIAISGFTTPKAEVFILKNGEKNTQVTADDSGNFSTDVSLSEGENRISAYSANGKLESEASQEFFTIFDNQEPKLEVTEPVDGQTIEGKKNQTATIKGTTEGGSRIYLNGRLVFVGEDGTFSTTHHLENGENILNFVITDKAGNTSEQEMKVNFRE